jgi:hypothetical protein
MQARFAPAAVNVTKPLCGLRLSSGHGPDGYQADTGAPSERSLERKKTPDPPPSSRDRYAKWQAIWLLSARTMHCLWLLNAEGL